MVRPERFELPTCCSGGNRSIQLSYGRMFLTAYKNQADPFKFTTRRLFTARISNASYYHAN